MPSYESGIIGQDEVDPQLGKQLDVSNGYGGGFAGTYYYVIAGGSLDGAPDGELNVVASPTMMDGPSEFRHHTLPGHGALMVQSASLPDIVVKTADGGTYAFNLELGTFTP